ncbi:MAG TPA: VWA domain-containing protein, partial [Planctomycetota bacterium]|nr:VWA domain-containing protein [Planctomycetota bacterium]
GGTPATVALFVDGFRMGEPRRVTLVRGENRIASGARLPESGSHEYSVQVRADADTFDGNNAASTVVVLPPALRVLVIEETEGDARYLVRALGRAGLETDVRTADGFPTDLVDLDRYAAVVLSDVPATSLLPAQMRMLKVYVEDLGGGFVMTGGEDSFGPGGYFRTPVEEILPVRLDVEKKKEEPTVAMVLCLDKSGSMRGRKVELVKEAAAATLDLLGADDLVGVVSFDTSAYKVSPLTTVSNRARVVGTIASIEAGGGTNMYPALEEAYAELREAKAKVKHVILLTDGKTHDGDYASLVRRMVRDGISVSCVAAGGDADAVLLQNVSRWGRGRFYFARDALSIPQIFARETVTAARSAVVEEPFRPRVVRDVEVIRGIDFTEAPYLLGYVSTKPKATGEVILASERAEPLLARGRAGLGKTVAFTSDVTNRWSAEWISWPGFEKFWAQVLRDVMRTRAPGTVDLKLRFEDDRGVLTLDAVDVAGRFRNRMNVGAVVVTPERETKRFELVQVSPGRYRGGFAADAPGTYVASVELGRAGSVEDAGDLAVVGAVKPPPAEFTSLDVDRDRLRDLAGAAGGEFVAPEAWAASDADLDALANRLASPSTNRVEARHATRPALLWTALALFFADLVMRRVDFGALGRRKLAPSTALGTGGGAS